jgi:SAM-dependent methyltransferase
MITNARTYWDKHHGEMAPAASADAPSDFALHCDPLMSARAVVLDLGCGNGRDAVYFADHGHRVVATDYSAVAIEQAGRRYTQDNLQFQVQDLTQPFPFPDGEFGVVYAHMSLHYFNHADTARIFTEIARVLRPGGQLLFKVKSTDDPLYGDGDQVEPNVFNRGGLRHFFDPNYINELLAASGLEISHLDHLRVGDLYGHPSAFLTVHARKV